MLRPVQIGVKDDTLHHAARRRRTILTQFLQRKHSTACGLQASCGLRAFPYPSSSAFASSTQSRARHIRGMQAAASSSLQRGGARSPSRNLAHPLLSGRPWPSTSILWRAELRSPRVKAMRRAHGCGVGTGSLTRRHSGRLPTAAESSRCADCPDQESAEQNASTERHTAAPRQLALFDSSDVIPSDAQLLPRPGCLHAANIADQAHGQEQGIGRIPDELCLDGFRVGAKEPTQVGGSQRRQVDDHARPRY
jgi:hypothetical protein